MSQIVLIVCAIFVLWLLYLDHKQSLKVSLGSWIPTIWMLVTVTKPLAVWFNCGGATNEEGSVMDRFFLIALLCIGMITLAKRKVRWSKVLEENIWLLLLIGYMLLSCLWSDFPMISLKRWSRELIAVVMALIIVTESNPRNALESIFRRIIYISIPFSYVLINYFSEYGRLYVHKEGVLMWIGVTLHKNQLGQLCLLSVFYLIWTFVRRWQGRGISAIRYQTYLEAIIIILTIWIMGGPDHSITYSATTTVSLVVGLTVLVGLSWKKKWGAIHGSKALILIVSFIFVYGTITPMVGKLTLLDPSSTLGRDETLTGRTSVWEQLIPVAMERPILGCGYGGFWTSENQELYDISGAHNGYLSVILELGFVGLIFFLFYVLSICRKAGKETNYNYDWACLKNCFILMMVVYNITESSLDTLTTRITAVTLLLGISPTFSSYAKGVSRRKRHFAA
ncbi:MAG: O-antigen ligase family protein [Deltaproteobacteria bacterium]|nr:O-antigen ligase family protein [Deltaproteobacteria bacterium]